MFILCYRITPQRAACRISEGIIEGDHFHENGLMVLYQHAGIKWGMLFPEMFILFLTLSFSFKYD